jgi:hypothetical protein
MLGTNGKPPQRGLDDQLEQPLRTAAQLGEFIVAQLAVRERLRRGGRQCARRIEHGCVGAPGHPSSGGAIDPNAPRSRAGQAGVRGSSAIDASTRDHSLSGSRLGASSPSASSASRANRSSVAASSKTGSSRHRRPRASSLVSAYKGEGRRECDSGGRPRSDTLRGCRGAPPASRWLASPVGRPRCTSP